MDYTRLSLSELKSALLDAARDTPSTFGDLDGRRLNWRPRRKALERCPVLRASLYREWLHAQQRETAAWAGTLDAHDAAQRIMISAFIRIVTYSILDGLRLWVARDHRHFQQARRVLLSSDSPKS